MKQLQERICLFVISCLSTGGAIWPILTSISISAYCSPHSHLPTRNITYNKTAVSKVLNNEPNRSFADLLINGGEWSSQKANEEWKLVEFRRKHRNRFIGSKGKAESSSTCKFKAADTKIPLFISNVHTDVTESDIVEYIFEKTKEKVSLLKIKRDL